MIVYRKWGVKSQSNGKITIKDGWFLLGLIPLYVRSWKDY